jgi:phosphoribosylformimino-5-aminoimidazole carboxamide ribotide isomerase
VRVVEGTPRVRTHGWTADSGVTLWAALARFPRGLVRHVLCTDTERDGALTGPNIALYRAGLTHCPGVLWQASGGVRGVEDLKALAAAGVAAAVSGKALLEDRIASEELRPYLPGASFPASTCATAGS